MLGSIDLLTRTSKWANNHLVRLILTGKDIAVNCDFGKFAGSVPNCSLHRGSLLVARAA